MLMPQSEIEALTGYARSSAQVRWLQRHGWRFSVNALGQPKVAVAEFNKRMVGGRAATQEPNWGALDGPQAHAR
jgi:hypothetical protein